MFHFSVVKGKVPDMRKDAAENHKALVEAATTLIAQMGPKVSLRTIAKEAEVGVATASRHFPTKDDLYRAVLENIIDKMRAIVDKHVPRLPGAPEATWRCAITEMVDNGFPAVVQEFLPVFAPHMGQEERNILIEKVKALYRPLLTEAKKYGLCPGDLDVLDFHFGIITLSRPLPTIAEEVFARSRGWLVDVFIDGLRAQAEGSQSNHSQSTIV